MFLNVKKRCLNGNGQPIKNQNPIKNVVQWCWWKIEQKNCTQKLNDLALNQLLENCWHVFIINCQHGQRYLQNSSDPSVEQQINLLFCHWKRFHSLFWLKKESLVKILDQFQKIIGRWSSISINQTRWNFEHSRHQHRWVGILRKVS